jgi:uncharacterized membrane protein YhaH (DUF805 family)
VNLLQLWFGLTQRVTRRTYIVSGLGLMALKTIIDFTLVWFATGKLWSPLAYLAPSLILKEEMFNTTTGAKPEWALIAMAVIALPFLWIGITMSVRRAADAGISPWFGVVFFVPIANYIGLIVLSALPSKEGRGWALPPGFSYRASPHPPPTELAPPDIGPGVRSALLGLLLATAIGLGMIGVSVYSMKLYGAALFLGTPFLMGSVTAFAYNMNAERNLGWTILLGCGSIVLAGSAILLFAIEGILCLAMAAPIALVLAVFGSILGWVVAKQVRYRPAALGIALAALPLVAGIEAKTSVPELHEAVSSIEIDAPPEVVWNHVTGFTELPPPPQWFFKLGIAYPMRARIDGEGVGAVRHCEFSTGPFVEPITTWDKPNRLAFDVTSQPPSMTELSPYRHVNAPHLEGYMVSKRGEFRLIPLPGNRTRLEGSTWYTLAIFPETYWTPWGEALLHSIHGRVLDHIKHLSEADIH